MPERELFRDDLDIAKALAGMHKHTVQGIQRKVQAEYTRLLEALLQERQSEAAYRLDGETKALRFVLDILNKELK